MSDEVNSISISISIYLSSCLSTTPHLHSVMRFKGGPDLLEKELSPFPQNQKLKCLYLCNPMVYNNRNH